MDERTEIHPIIVGTSGHVDHGKSSLVQRLTGIDPDRLREEKERGLTIDLGFARMELTSGQLVGLIDVPGHEKFIKNMVAGATSIDLAMLVVAADDAVMPQTREHLDVLELLGVERGFVALTKVDLVDEETLELAEEDVRELLEGRFLEGAKIVRVSSTTGEGFDELRSTLEALAAELPPRSTDGIFRMPVQRVFSVQGFGAVLTGIPLAGSVQIGDHLEIAGKGLRSRIRSIQAYGRKVERARSGHSTALNLPDIPLDRAERGDVLVVPGTLESTERLEIDLRMVRDVRVLKHGEEVHLHLGTREVVARCFLLDQKGLGPGERGLVQVQTYEPVVCLPGDRALIRRLTPARTIGGGRVIGTGGRRLRRFKDEILEHLEEKEQALDSPRDRVRLAIHEMGEKGLQRDALPGRLGMTDAELVAPLEELESQALILVDPKTGRCFGSASAKREMERVRKMLGGWFRKHPMSTTCPISRFRREGVEELLSVSLAGMQQQGEVEILSGGMLRDLSRKDPMSAEDRAEMQKLASWLEEAGARAHTRDEIQASHGKAGLALLERLLETGEAQAVGPTFIWGGKSFASAMEIVEEVCGAHDGVLDIPELRDRLGTSRKFLIPFLEHLDRIGVTARKGDRRILRRN